MIGQILKNMRIEKELSQKDLGKKLNIADNTISSYERGNSQPDFETIIKIAKICDYELLFKNKNGTKKERIDFKAEIEKFRGGWTG